MSSSSDKSINSEGYNAKLYIHKLTGGAIHFDDTWIGDRVLALQPTISTLQVPHSPSITTKLLTSGRVTIELPKTTFEGTVHIDDDDRQISIRGEISCDLRKVELMKKHHMYSYYSQDSWFHQLKGRDVISGFKSIGIESKCGNKIWMKDLYYIPEAESKSKVNYDSSDSERSPKYINIKWDEKTQSVHRTWENYHNLMIDLSMDRETTVQRNLTMIDQGVSWMYKEGVDGRLQSVNEDNGNEEEARLISGLNMELINGISERRANTHPTVTITGRSILGDSNSVEENGLSTLNKMLSLIWTPTSTND